MDPIPHRHLRHLAVNLLCACVVTGAIVVPGYFAPGMANSEDAALVEEMSLLVLLLGSSVALVLALVTAYRLARGLRTRTWKSLALAAVSGLIALPGLYVGWFFVRGFIYSQLPLTASEIQAIDVAERFVERNGYTTAGHPKGLPVLQNDIMDPLAGSTENLLEMRRGTLQAKALGVRSFGSHYLVFFDSIPPRAGGAYRTVEVSQGEAMISHSDMFAGQYKSNER